MSFDVSVRRTARRVAGLGLAYDNELGGRMWVGAVDRRLFDLALEGSSALFLGEFRKELYLGLPAELSARPAAHDPYDHRPPRLRIGAALRPGRG